jgi:hypothetical protein
LGFASFLALLLLFVEEFSQVHHLANGGIGIGCNLNQVQFGFTGNFLGFFYGYYSNVFPFGIN